MPSADVTPLASVFSDEAIDRLAGLLSSEDLRDQSRRIAGHTHAQLSQLDTEIKALTQLAIAGGCAETLAFCETVSGLLVRYREVLGRLTPSFGPFSPV